MRSVGFHLALVWMAATAAACFEHSSPRADSQSHWLRQCDASADCGGDLACICGVCTERCERNGDCDSGDAPASCTVVDSVGGCEGTGAGELVCLADCSEDDDCRAGGRALRCVAGSCVGPEHSGGDAGTVPVGGPGVLTVEGYLECDALLARVDELREELHVEHDSCETHADCACVDDSTRCGGRCGTATRTDRVDVYSSELEAISEDYCSAENLYRVCRISTPGCPECAAICLDGHCQVRPATSNCFEWNCTNDRLCHLDGTCIDPGTEDRLGIATLAMAAAPPEELEATRGIRQFAVTADSIFWFDAGTFDASTGHNRDGAIHRLELASGERTVLVSGMGVDHPGVVEVDDSWVYYTDSLGAHAVPRDASAEPVQLFERVAEDWPPSVGLGIQVAPWFVDEDWIYYAGPHRSPAVRRVRADGTGDEPFYEAEEGTVHRLGGTATHLLVEVIGVSEPGTRLERVDKQTGLSETLVATFRESPSDQDGPLLAAGDVVVIDASQQVAGNTAARGVRRYSLSSGERVDLVSAELSTAQVRSIAGGRAYFSASSGDGAWLGRAPLEPTDPEQLRTSAAEIGHVVAADGYLYWVEAHRLLRMPLPE